MDFLIELPKTEAGHNGVLVIIDRFSKMAKFLPTKDPAMAEYIADLVFKGIVAQHGVPRSITSDRDSRFTSTLW